MAQKSDAQLTTDATVIRDETDAGENTAIRVGGHMIDNIDSKINIDKIVDEDDMASNSATLVPTQQSVKAYVDASAGAVDSVNGQTGVVVLDAGDVGADPTGTAAGKVSDTAYDATSWNGVNDVAPSKNAIRDKIESLDGEKQDLVNSATTITDASTMDITAIKNTLATSSATRTFTISYTGDDITLEVILSATSSTFTFPATALCVSDGLASGDNTLPIAGISGDKYIIAIKKIGSAYYVVSKNFGQ